MREFNHRWTEWILLAVAVGLSYVCGSINFEGRASRAFNEKHWQYKHVEQRPSAILDSSPEELSRALAAKPTKILKLLEGREAAAIEVLNDRIAAKAEKCLGYEKAAAWRLNDQNPARKARSETAERILESVVDDKDRADLARLFAQREKLQGAYEKLRAMWLLRTHPQGLRDWVRDVRHRADLAKAANNGLWGRSASNIFQVLVSEDSENTRLIKYANLYVPIQNALVTGEDVSGGDKHDYPLNLRSPAAAKLDAMHMLCLMLVSFVAAGAALWFFVPRANQLVLPILCSLTSIGANILYLYKDPLNTTPLTINFCFHVFLGLAVFVLIVFALGILNQLHSVRRLNVLGNIRLRNYRMLAFGGLALLLLLLSWLFGSGRGGLSLLGLGQLSGPISALAILHMAMYLHEVAGRMTPSQSRWLRFWKGHWLWRGPWLSRERIDTFLPLTIFCVILVGLFLLKKDLGPVLVLFYAFLTMYCVATFRPVLATLGVFGFLPAIYSIAYFIFPTWRLVRVPLERLEMAVHPFEAANIDVAASLWGFASGGYTGSGPAVANPSLINLGSAAHNDFVLSGVGEAYGLCGVALAVGLTASLVFTLFFSAYKTHGFFKYLLIGSGAYLGVQAVINALGVLGWLPMTGLPFTFVSYGGMSIVTGFVLLALCLVVSHHSADEREDGRAATSWAGIFYLAAFAAIFYRAILVMGGGAGEIAARPALGLQEDGVRRFVNNPRLEEIRRSLTKATILDANGLPLATSDLGELIAHKDEYVKLGLFDAQTFETKAALQKTNGRYYLLGHSAGQLLQQIDSPLIQVVRLESGLEPEQYRQPESEKFKEALYRYFWGFGIKRTLHRVGQGRRLADGSYEKNDVAQYKNNLEELIPALRDRGHYPKGEYAKLRNTPRQVQISINAKLQLAAQSSLEKAMEASSGYYADKKSRTSGAACVIDTGTGMVLASVSLPNEAVSAALFEPFYSTAGVMHGAIVRAAVNEINSGVQEKREQLGKLRTGDNGIFQALLGSATMKAAMWENAIAPTDLKRIILAVADLERARDLNKNKEKLTNILSMGKLNFSDAVCNAMKPRDRALKTGQDKLLRDAVSKVIEAKSRMVAMAMEKSAPIGGQTTHAVRAFAGIGVEKGEISAALNGAIGADCGTDRVSAPDYPCPPGSIFKLVTAAAALDESANNNDHKFKDFTIDCTGHHTFHGSVTIRDNENDSHQRTGLHKAMVKSCNVFFAMLGDALGGERIHAAAKRLLDPNGVGKTVKSLEDIKRDRLPAVSYGQEVAVRPIDMASLAATIANGGLREEPQLVPGFAGQGGGGGYAMAPSSANALRRAMIDVVREGTAKDLKLADLGLIVGAKTGTAEVNPERPHSWFVGFAQKRGNTGKAKDKGIAFVFLVENGGYGGKVAGAAAKDFLVKYREAE